VALAAPQADAVSEIVQAALCGLRWQQTHDKETNPELQMIAGKIRIKVSEVMNFQQLLAEMALEPADADGEDSDPTACLLRATKLLQRALELQYQAVQCGNADVSAQCTEVGYLLLPITSPGSTLFTFTDRRRGDPYNVNDARRAVGALCRRGELELCAITAKLAGRSDSATIWEAAAAAAARAVRDSNHEDEEMDARLQYGWQCALQRAEALAEVAQRAEVAAAVSAAV
jgi:hypothetical protein